MVAKTWFITGISSGFGREFAQQLLERGDRVAGTVRRADAVKDLKETYGEKLWIQSVDMTDLPRVQHVVEEAFRELGSIDVIVNNAGYGLFGAIESLTEEQILHQLETNLIAPILITKVALPHLRAQGGGKILAVSTYGGQATLPGASMYHASKWGLEGFFDSIAAEVASFNISVAIAEPGGARTQFRAAAERGMGQDLPAYKDTPVGMMRTILSDPARKPKGDSVLMVRRMIEAVEASPAPRRVVLGSDSYFMIQKALAERLADVELQRDSAATTDLPEGT